MSIVDQVCGRLRYEFFGCTRLVDMARRYVDLVHRTAASTNQNS